MNLGLCLSQPPKLACQLKTVQDIIYWPWIKLMVIMRQFNNFEPTVAILVEYGHTSYGFVSVYTPIWGARYYILTCWITHD